MGEDILIVLNIENIGKQKKPRRMDIIDTDLLGIDNSVPFSI